MRIGRSLYSLLPERLTQILLTTEHWDFDRPALGRRFGLGLRIDPNCAILHKLPWEVLFFDGFLSPTEKQDLEAKTWSNSAASGFLALAGTLYRVGPHESNQQPPKTPARSLLSEHHFEGRYSLHPQFDRLEAEILRQPETRHQKCHLLKHHRALTEGVTNLAVSAAKHYDTLAKKLRRQDFSSRLRTLAATAAVRDRRESGTRVDHFILFGHAIPSCPAKLVVHDSNAPPETHYGTPKYYTSEEFLRASGIRRLRTAFLTACHTASEIISSADVSPKPGDASSFIHFSDMVVCNHRELATIAGLILSCSLVHALNHCSPLSHLNLLDLFITQVRRTIAGLDCALTQHQESPNEASSVPNRPLLRLRQRIARLTSRLPMHHDHANDRSEPLRTLIKAIHNHVAYGDWVSGHWWVPVLYTNTPQDMRLLFLGGPPISDLSQKQLFQFHKHRSSRRRVTSLRGPSSKRNVRPIAS